MAKHLIFGFLLTYILVLILQIIVPYAGGCYIDSLLGRHPAVVLFVAGIGILNFSSMILDFCMTYILTKLNNTFLYKICNSLFQKIYKLPLKYFRSQDSVFLTDQVTGDAATIAEFILNGIPDLIYNLVLVIASAVIIFKVDFFLGILIIITIPVYFFTYKKLENKMYQNEQLYKEAGNDYTSKGTEQIRCTKFVKENALEEEMEERFLVSFQNMLKCAIGQIKTQYLFSNLNRVIMTTCYLLIIGIGGYKVMTGHITVGYFTIINSYLTMIISATSDIIDFSGSVPEYKVALDRMDGILSQELLIDNKQDKIYEKIQRIELRNIQFSYDNSVLFKQFNCIFEKNNIYGIYGENGTGKSSLLDAIIGLYPECCDGTILYNNKNLEQYDMDRMLKAEISFLEQNAEKLNISAKEYIRFGIDDVDSEKEKNLISCFFQDDYAVIESMDNINLCSGGEMEKLSLVRILQKKSSLLILDEPTTGLDYVSVNNLKEVLLKEKREKIIIIVTHDESIMEDVINVIDIEKYYAYDGNFTKAVKRVTFNVRNGEFISIMGKSGSGKTSLLNIIATIDFATAGHIIFEGKDITVMSDDEKAEFRKQNIGFIFQDYNLIDTLTIRENICIPLIMNKYDKKIIGKMVENIMKQLDILDIKDKYPYQVSGGQQQRCACARALIYDKKYLFADEPTGALDTRSSINLMETFKMINRKFGTTILMVTHDPVSSSFSDRVLFLEDGKIVYELLKGNKDNEKMLEEILNVQRI